MKLVTDFSKAPPAGLMEVLEKMLEEAKAGRLLGLVAVGSNSEGLTSSVISVGPHTAVMPILGELEATKARFMKEHVEGCE